MTTGFIYDPRFLEHHTGPGHPERPERLQAILRHLQNQDWFSQLRPVKPRIADEEILHAVHSLEYLRRAQETCESGFAFLDTPDVGVSPNSFEIAKLAAGSALELADKVMSREIQNGFALVRPPGHHAEEDYAMGFCLLNNIAILARYLQTKHHLDKILILDWDVHHGNGTQHTFEEDPSVFYVSLHQYPFYPGTGAAHEKGIGRGEGATLNCPMEAGSSDAQYREAFETRILPAIKIFKPEAVLISAGFDAHSDDPLASMRLSTKFFGWMSEQMMEVADKFASGRLISLLEGGYNLDVLPLCVAEHLKWLSGQEVRSKR
jgi:acetoin utilization deacetylase AcuC-like enzyme